jgi:pyochelin synthetase
MTWNKAEFDRLVNGIDKTADVVADGLSKKEIESAMANLDNAVLHSMLYALLKLGLFGKDEKHSIEDILENGRIVSKYHWLVRRWIAKLTKAGLLLESPHGHFSCPKKTSTKIIARYWAEADELWMKKIATGFTVYVRSNTEKLPELLRDQQDPLSLLFPDGKYNFIRSLYFDNLMANYLNSCICTLLKRIAESRSGKILRILELGAGTGATTEKALKALENFEMDYLFTDVATAFVTRAKSRFEKFPGMHFGVFNVDEDYRIQGLSSNSFDIVLAAGVLENARDIPATMNRLVELICPGGWLVFTEPTEEHSWILASQAFMMTAPDDNLRVETSYLDKEAWINLLKEYGDESIVCLPDLKHKLSPIGVHLFAKRFN